MQNLEVYDCSLLFFFYKIVDSNIKNTDSFDAPLQLDQLDQFSLQEMKILLDLL